MQATRLARLASVIQEELSTVVPREIKDPRVPSVIFTRVEITPDASQATVFVMISGSLVPSQDPKPDMAPCIAGLTSAAGYLRKHLAKVLTIRHIPALLFKEDKGLTNSLRVHEILKSISQETKPESKEIKNDDT